MSARCAARLGRPQERGASAYGEPVFAIAQTFAVQNQINGFGQDPLPISPGEVTALGWPQSRITRIISISRLRLFRVTGDAKYGGETFASKNIALWVDSNLGTTEDNIELEPPIDSTSGTETFSLIVAYRPR